MLTARRRTTEHDMQLALQALYMHFHCTDCIVLAPDNPGWKQMIHVSNNKTMQSHINNTHAMQQSHTSPIMRTCCLTLNPHKRSLPNT